MVRIRVRAAQNEVEVEAELGHIKEVIELIPEIISKFPAPSAASARFQSTPTAASVHPGQEPTPMGGSLPSVSIDKGDSLGDILSKFFADQWGKNPRRLSDVREALQSYGLNYPKQSVAVALLRLAKSSRIRRFKSEGGEFVYTASTSMIVAPMQAQVGDETQSNDEAVTASLETDRSTNI